MPNSTAIKRGFNWDEANSRLDFYVNGTRVGHLDANGFTLANAGISNSIVQNAGLTSALKRHTFRMGSMAAVASNGAGAILTDPIFVAPAALKVTGVWKTNITGSDVTVGTATSSASYRRFTLIANTAAAGSGTDIIASLNATASAASLVSRSFTTINSSVPAGSIILLSHLTVGAETADGTTAAAAIIELEYELV